MTAYTKLDNMDRIERLEKSVGALVDINYKQSKVNDELRKKNKKLKKLIVTKVKEKIDHVYGRDKEIAENFELITKEYEANFLKVSDRVTDLAEIIEDLTE